MINLAIMLFLTGCTASSQKQSDTHAAVAIQQVEQCANIIGGKACNFSAVDADENDVELTDLMGSPFILDLSAMWCGPCKLAAQGVQVIQGAYSDYGLQYVTLIIEDTTGNPPNTIDLQFWKDQAGITTAPVWAGSRELLTPNPVETGSALYLDSWPTFYFFDSDMRMKAYQVGFNDALVDENIGLIISDENNE